MSLPFTHDQFLDVFGAYNLIWWPVAAGLWILTLAAVALLATGRPASRFLAALLAVHWLWSGVVYHLTYFATINPAAKLFGALFIVQAALLAWFGVVWQRLRFTWGRAPRHILSMVFVGYALVYPLLAVVGGLHWPRMPAFAVPCPTTLLTVGLLLALEPGRLRGLAVIPLLWTAIGGSAALVLGVRPDLMLLAAGAVLLVYLIKPRLLGGAPAAAPVA